MNPEKLFPSLIALVIALLLYQTYNIYAENEIAEAPEEEALAPSEGTVPPPLFEGTAPVSPAEGTVPLPPAEVTVSVPPAEGVTPVPPPVPVPVAPVVPVEGIIPLTPVETTAPPVPPAEGTLPLPPAEATAPLPAAEETIPLPPIEITLPVLPTEGFFWTTLPSERKKENVGSDKCRSCHEDQHDRWSNTIHAKWQPSFTTEEKAKQARMECETCHGPGSLHLEDYKERLFITSFGPLSKDTKEEQNAVCISCHNKGKLYYWDGGVHGRMLRCADCHAVMENVSARFLLKKQSEKEICLKCHIQKKGRAFRSPHLSQDEAKMTCSTCHAPHGSDTDGLLTSSSVNENCYRCHADKRGPYLFDHLPVQENCLLCHDPHASLTRPLLKVRQPFLCLECHTNLPVNLPLGIDPHNVLDPQSRFTYNRGCTNCHPMIHGSRHPSGARFQR